MSSIPAKALALLWSAAKSRLDRAKANELYWRKLVERSVFANATLGVNRVAIDEGQDLKFTKRQNVSFKWDTAKWSAAWFAATPEQQEELRGVVYQEWQFDQAAYKALSDAARKLVDDSGILEIKDGTPALEIAAAKKGE